MSKKRTMTRNNEQITKLDNEKIYEVKGLAGDEWTLSRDRSDNIADGNNVIMILRNLKIPTAGRTIRKQFLGIMKPLTQLGDLGLIRAIMMASTEKNQGREVETLNKKQITIIEQKLNWGPGTLEFGILSRYTQGSTRRRKSL